MTLILNWSTKAGQSATNYIKKGYISIAIMVGLFRVGLFCAYFTAIVNLKYI